MKNDSLQNEPMELNPDEFFSESRDKHINKSSRKKSAFIKIFSFFIALIIIVMTISSVLIGTANYSKEDLNRNIYVSKVTLKNSPFVTNILLIGADDDSEGSSRSDSMIIVSLDFVHRKIKLTSLLRDMYIYIPEKDKNSKLNAAYAYGGPQSLCDTIEYNFNIDIDHYIKVDFKMFTQIIDCLGGIDVEVTEKEAKFINKTTKQKISSGKNVHLNGEEALVYSRIRKLDSDYMRTQRQRKVISAIISKAKNTSPSEMLDYVQKILPLLVTDLSSFEISSLICKSGFSFLLFDIQ